MNIASLFFLFVPALGFLSWTLRFRGLFSYTALAPGPFLLVAIFAVNSDPTVQYNVDSVGCPTIPDNSTAVTVNGTTTTTYGKEPCHAVSGSASYTIEPNIMTILNYLTFAGIFTVFFIVFRRVTRKPSNRDESEAY